MNFGQAIKNVFKNYVSFSGRARLSEFWWWYLFLVIVNTVLTSIWSATTTMPMWMMENPTFLDYYNVYMTALLSNPMYYVVLLWGLATILPTISVAARRLHDSDKSAGWLWLFLLLGLGGLIILIMCLLPGTAGKNRFGDAAPTKA